MVVALGSWAEVAILVDLGEGDDHKVMEDGVEHHIQGLVLLLHRDEPGHLLPLDIHPYHQSDTHIKDHQA